MRKIISTIITVLLCLSLSGTANAAALLVAVASNFTRPMEQIAPLFTEATGIEIKSSVASTGKLYAMIQHGAPFDVFLAADSQPDLLSQDGLCEKPFVYAQGRPVLWSPESNLCELKEWRQAVRSSRVRQIAIANPETAPYGNAVKKVLSSLPVQQDIMKRLVYTQNAGQAFQYAEKITDAGFTSASFALSEEGRRGCYWPIPEAESVLQKGCVLQRVNEKKEAHLFVSFLNDPKVKSILDNFGYVLE